MQSEPPAEVTHPDQHGIEAAKLSAVLQSIPTVPEAAPVAGIKRRRTKKIQSDVEVPTTVKKKKVAQNPRPPRSSLGKKKEQSRSNSTRKRANRARDGATFDPFIVADIPKVDAHGNQVPQVGGTAIRSTEDPQPILNSEYPQTISRSSTQSCLSTEDDHSSTSGRFSTPTHHTDMSDTSTPRQQYQELEDVHPSQFASPYPGPPDTPSSSSSVVQATSFSGVRNLDLGLGFPAVPDNPGPMASGQLSSFLDQGSLNIDRSSMPIYHPDHQFRLVSDLHSQQTLQPVTAPVQPACSAIGREHVQPVSPVPFDIDYFMPPTTPNILPANDSLEPLALQEKTTDVLAFDHSLPNLGEAFLQEASETMPCTMQTGLVAHASIGTIEPESGVRTSHTPTTVSCPSLPETAALAQSTVPSSMLPSSMLPSSTLPSVVSPIRFPKNISLDSGIAPDNSEPSLPSTRSHQDTSKLSNGASFPTNSTSLTLPSGVALTQYEAPPPASSLSLIPSPSGPINLDLNIVASDFEAASTLPELGPGDSTLGKQPSRAIEPVPHPKPGNTTFSPAMCKSPSSALSFSPDSVHLQLGTAIAPPTPHELSSSVHKPENESSTATESNTSPPIDSTTSTVSPPTISMQPSAEHITFEPNIIDVLSCGSSMPIELERSTEEPHNKLPVDTGFFENPDILDNTVPVPSSSPQPLVIQTTINADSTPQVFNLKATQGPTTFPPTIMRYAPSPPGEVPNTPSDSPLRCVAKTSQVPTSDISDQSWFSLAPRSLSGTLLDTSAISAAHVAPPNSGTPRPSASQMDTPRVAPPPSLSNYSIPTATRHVQDPGVGFHTESPHANHLSESPSARNALDSRFNLNPEIQSATSPGPSRTSANNGKAPAAPYPPRDSNQTHPPLTNPADWNAPRPTHHLPPPSLYAHLLNSVGTLVDKVDDMSSRIGTQMETLRQDMQNQINDVRRNDELNRARHKIAQRRSDKAQAERIKRSLGVHSQRSASEASTSQLRRGNTQGSLGAQATATTEAESESRHRANNMFKKAVRDHLQKLLGTKNIQRIMANNPPLTPEQNQAFSERKHGAPRTSAEEFHFDFSKAYRDSEFNQAARHAFVTDFQAALRGGSYRSYRLSDGMDSSESITSAFDSRIRSIKRDVKMAASPDMEANKAALGGKRRRTSRQSTTFANRISTIIHHPPLNHHFEIYKHQRPCHMSGDESEYDEHRKRHPPTFKVVYPKWQSREMRNFNEQLDELYRNAWGQPPFARGNPPRTLNTTGEVSTADTRAPPGLPENCYDADWLKALNPWVKDSLQVRWDVMWDFTIPDNITRSHEMTDEYRAKVNELRARVAAEGEAFMIRE